MDVAALILMGSLFGSLAAVGLIRLPDTLIRMQTATKAGRLGAGLILAAVALMFADIGTVARSLLALVFSAVGVYGGYFVAVGLMAIVFIGVLNMLVSLASFVPIIVAGPLADVLSAAAVIIIFAALVMIIGIASIVFAHPRVTGSAHPTNVEPLDPMTITTASSTLNRPIRLRYIAEDMEATRPIRIIASPVVPGKAGPAQEPPSGTDPGT